MIVEKSWKNADASGDMKLLPSTPEEGKDFNETQSKASKEEDVSTSSDHKPVYLQYSASASAVASDIANTRSGKKPVLQHAKSLDSLLTTHRRITVFLNSDKMSKYSNMTITASMDMLNKEMLVAKESTTSSASGNSKLYGFII